MGEPGGFARERCKYDHSAFSFTNNPTVGRGAIQKQKERERKQITSNSSGPQNSMGVVFMDVALNSKGSEVWRDAAMEPEAPSCEDKASIGSIARGRTDRSSRDRRDIEYTNTQNEA